MEYEPYEDVSWVWYNSDRVAGESPDVIPGNLFHLLQAGVNRHDDYGELYCREYASRDRAMDDLAQAQAALKAQEEQAVTTTTEKTQGEYTWESVQVGDRVRITEADAHGDPTVVEGVVRGVDTSGLSIIILSGHGQLRFWKRENKSIELVSRPPRRVEISKDDLILRTPIGTKLVLEFPGEPGQKAGAATEVFRDHVGWAVAIDRATVYYLDDIKAIYTEEVQG